MNSGCISLSSTSRKWTTWWHYSWKHANMQQIDLILSATVLLDFFKLGRNDAFAKPLLYSDVYLYCAWKASTKVFKRRKQEGWVVGQAGIFNVTTMGRLYTFDPNQEKCFFLRMFVNMPAPTSVQQSRIVNGVTIPTFRSACQALYLLENNQHCDLCIIDVCNTPHLNGIRALFAIILNACSP